MCSTIYVRYDNILKNVPNECVGIAVIFPLPKHTCRRKHNSISLLSFFFMLQVGICLVSPNGNGKQYGTRHNLKTKAPMDKQSVLLDF